VGFSEQKAKRAGRRRKGQTGEPFGCRLHNRMIRRVYGKSGCAAAASNGHKSKYTEGNL
jgi:hypothetical protein